MIVSDNAVDVALQGRLVVRLTYSRPLTANGLAAILERFSTLDSAFASPGPLVLPEGWRLWPRVEGVERLRLWPPLEVAEVHTGRSIDIAFAFPEHLTYSMIAVGLLRILLGAAKGFATTRKTWYEGSLVKEQKRQLRLNNLLQERLQRVESQDVEGLSQRLYQSEQAVAEAQRAIAANERVLAEITEDLEESLASIEGGAPVERVQESLEMDEGAQSAATEVIEAAARDERITSMGANGITLFESWRSP